MKALHAHGKFLLTGEYFVLNGAQALAVPLSKGQHLSVESFPEGNSISWKSLDVNGRVWFEATLSLPDLAIKECSDEAIAGRLQLLLRNAASARPDFFSSQKSYRVSTRLEFPREWGLGTSSTLVWLVAKWLGVDPFELQFKTFGGSAYDIACAGASAPLLYRLKGGRPEWQELSYSPPFASQMWFVYLGRKQNSREEIARFKQKGKPASTMIREVDMLTDRWLAAATVADLQAVIADHEQLVGSFLGREPVKKRLFSDFPGEVKSLGAWGGDFVLAVSDEPDEFVKAWFQKKGYDICLNWSALVLH
ncbi:MAG: GHMP kinase [Saprospirales bacterium]|nr:GHMP kinase [Saprospirales bacterium]